MVFYIMPRLSLVPSTALHLLYLHGKLCIQNRAIFVLGTGLWGIEAMVGGNVGHG